MFNSRELFSDFVETEKLLISTSDPKSNLFATGRGTVVIEIENETVLLSNFLYVPHLSRNLISLLEMFSKSITIVKQNKDFSILDENRPILHRRIINNLMISNFTEFTSLLTTSSTKKTCWHSRLGHPSNKTLKSMGLPNFEKDHCDVCIRGKITLKPFKSHFEEVKEPLDCLHLDLVGPIAPPSISGHRFFLTIVDRFTPFRVVRFLKNKLDAIKEFAIVKNLIETAQGRKIKKVVSDRGGEFVNDEFKQLANESGFTHVTSPPYTPQLNGFAERTKRKILEETRCLLLGNAPRIKCIRTFGNKVVFVIPRGKRPWKLSPTGELRILLGFDYESPAYRILKLKDNKVLSTSDVEKFQSNEDTFFECQENPTDEAPSDSNDESTSQINDSSVESSSDDQDTKGPTTKINVIGTHHPTLISSDI
ncbi:hypothetical protein O181_047352 [Austropuccinia psidii MF-1]|uniref:Integrase catalytic domain-containing protein n=1 Tax=Austropuccinia psidii MF-1 TaxID=1389203 RepID=A0A9Q3DT08_9BASI|nr:hypothetical protein [Austropuccinia psidii MF-1]